MILNKSLSFKKLEIFTLFIIFNLYRNQKYINVQNSKINSIIINYKSLKTKYFHQNIKIRI